MDVGILQNKLTVDYIFFLIGGEYMSDDERYEPVPLGFGIEAAPPSYKAAISKKNESLFKVIRVLVSARAHKWERMGERVCTCTCTYPTAGHAIISCWSCHYVYIGT